jgi:hypothetical protein
LTVPGIWLFVQHRSPVSDRRQRGDDCRRSTRAEDLVPSARCTYTDNETRRLRRHQKWSLQQIARARPPDLILDQRGADMADLPGGARGILCRDYKGKEPTGW